MASNGAGGYSRASHTCSAWNYLVQTNFQTYKGFSNTLSICPIYTHFMSTIPCSLFVFYSVLQPLKCVSHENRPARHAIKWSRRLFSCLAHMQCMEPSCTNKITDLKPFRKNFVNRSLTSLFALYGKVPTIFRRSHFYLKKIS